MGFREPQLESVESDTIVVVDASIFVDAKNLGQIQAGVRAKSRTLLLG
jgi:hypothetical protein